MALSQAGEFMWTYQAETVKLTTVPDTRCETPSDGVLELRLFDEGGV
jgi:hypothetical protein